MPVLPCRRHASQQVIVHALVYDPEEAEAGARDVRLIDGIPADVPRAREMSGVHAAGKLQDMRMVASFRVVQTATAGKHHIGHAEQLSFIRLHLLGSAGKRRQLIHTVIDDRHGAEMIGKRESHRGVVPEDELLPDMGAHRRIEQLPLDGKLATQVFRKMGDGHQDPAAARRDVHVRYPVAPHRLFDVEHAPFSRRAIQQVLRTLQDKVPT